MRFLYLLLALTFSSTISMAMSCDGLWDKPNYDHFPLGRKTYQTPEAFLEGFQDLLPAFAEAVAAEPRWKKAARELEVTGTYIEDPVALQGEIIVGINRDLRILSVNAFAGEVLAVRDIANSERAFYVAELKGPKGLEQVQLSVAFQVHVWTPPVSLKPMGIAAVDALPLERVKFYNGDDWAAGFASARHRLKAALNPSMWQSAGPDFQNEGTQIQNLTLLEGKVIAGIHRQSHPGMVVSIFAGRVKSIGRALGTHENNPLYNALIEGPTGEQVISLHQSYMVHILK